MEFGSYESNNGYRALRGETLRSWSGAEVPCTQMTSWGVFSLLSTFLSVDSRLNLVVDISQVNALQWNISDTSYTIRWICLAECRTIERKCMETARNCVVALIAVLITENPASTGRPMQCSPRHISRRRQLSYTRSLKFVALYLW